MSATTIHKGDALVVLRTLPGNSFDCCVTSPPYFQQRDYGVEGQIGRESCVDAYVERLATVFDEVRRVLKPHGNLFLNLGDKLVAGELLGAPWLVALDLRRRGWTLRMDNIWAKPSGIAEPLRKRSTPAHEYVFHFTKTRGRDYFYDPRAVAEPTALEGRPQRRRAEQLFVQAGLTDDHLIAIHALGMNDAGKARVTQNSFGKNTPAIQRLAGEAKAVLGGYFREFLTGDTKNRRSVWTIAPAPSGKAHVAPFPDALAALCVQAGSPPGGTVLDPFIGSGTTAHVANALGRACVGIDLNPEAAEVAA